ncbi:hypothetical protein [Arthrobacter sp. FW306-2-2C-D06B]|uniref:hypothetical protein n=1 Tax=Arthrobacter sp. FW306-2-2C-D06B TaxID=2879618 RepID=UPI001F15A06E|nr:hypothetical protein [Arthrobacter sp. FW306-2-2C-D06B]UKA57819.1 hypothetical protein LFT47_16260 [Arthrobacter sp. FW306-2-2C-D06B]
MSGFFGTILVLLVIFVTALVAYSSGRSTARSLAARAAQRLADDSVRQYRSGYLAGHLAGWRDAEAHREGAPSQEGVSRPPGAERGQTFAPAPVQTVPVRTAPVQTTPPAQAAPVWPVPVMPGPLPIHPQGARIPPEALREEQAARKLKRDRQNINVTLYVASLLLVAASALFIGTSLPSVLRFAGVWTITAAFYAGGFILHARAPRLRPAAIAFAGTGLALIPVTGLAMYNFALHNGLAAWLVTSIVGTVAYVVAAVRLDNRVLAFLSLSFVVSAAWSGVSMLGGALVWYFASLIGFAAVLTLAAMRRPRWLPPVYVRPLMSLHPYVVPFVALAASFVPQHLGKGEYAMIMMACGLYFAVMAAIPQGVFRLPQFYAARLSFTVAFLVALSDAGLGLPEVLLAAAVLFALQSLWSAFDSRRLARWFPVPGTPQAIRRCWIDAVVCFGLQLAAVFMAACAILVWHSETPLGIPLFATLVCSLVLAWKLGGQAEWLPATAIVVAAPFVDELGGWSTAALLATAGAFWLLRARRPTEPKRRVFVLAGRIALTLGVPAMTVGILPENPDRIAAVVLAFLAAATFQLLVEAALIRSGVRTFAPTACLAAFAGAGMAGMPLLVLFEQAPGQPLTVSAVVGHVLAVALLGWTLFPKAVRATLRGRVVEFLAPAALAWAGALSFGAVSVASGNVVLLVGVVYFSVQALRLPRTLHRRGYWWAARGLVTLLAGTAYLQLLREGGGLVVAGERLQLASVVFVALALQLIPPLAEALRGPDRGLAALDAAVVLPFMASAAVVSISGSYFDSSAAASWQAVAVSIIMAVSAVAAGFMLRSEGASAVFAPATLALLLLLRGAHLHEVEALLAIFAVFSAVMVAAVPERTAKGIYFITARFLTAAVAAVFAHDLSASATVVSLTFAGVLQLQHIIRWLMRNRLQQIPFQQAAVWVTLGAQAALPATYLSSVVQQEAHDGGRWVLLLELAVLLVSAVAANMIFTARGAVYFTIPASIAAVAAAGPEVSFPSGTWLAAPLLDQLAVSLVLLAMSLLVTVVRLLVQPGSGVPERWFWLVAAVAFTGAGGALSVDVSDTATGMAGLVLAIVCFVASHVEGMPGFYPLASAASLVGATVFASSALEKAPIVGRTGAQWADFLPWLLGCAGTAAVLYAVRWSRIRGVGSQPVRKLSLAVAAGGGFALAAVAGLLHDGTALAGTCLLGAVVAVAFLEAPRAIRFAVAELGAVLVLAAAQRAILFVHGSRPELFWVVQWFTVLGAVLAGLRYYAGNRLEGRIRLGLASGLLSLGGLLSIVPGSVFTGTVTQQLWVLIGCAVLLLAGLVLAERMFVWWGAAGVALSVMWALRSYAFAMLAVIALALIVLAVWRLNRTAP